MGVVSDEAHIVKGKRTKRQRLQLPALTGSSSIGGDDTNQDNNVSSFQYSQFQSQSPTSSAEFSGSTTEEEEDMANCLILLAQGRGGVDQTLLEKGGEGERFVGGGRRFVEAATTTNGKARFELYECKTCNRCFPSFQALGGHRASHKKPKTTAAVEEENQSNFLSLDKATPYSNQSTINKTRVHECSICGSEFSSGQALGGHMRRHRAVMAEPQENNKRQKVILSLDLNLPAPQEDDRDFLKSPSSFALAGKQPLVFSTSPPLVDCHY